MTVPKIVRSIAMGVIFTLIIISFAFFGMSKNMISGTAPTTVISAGGHETSEADFKRIFEQQRQDDEQQAKQPVSTEQMVAQGVDVGILQQLKLSTAVDVVLDRLGVKASLNMIADQMRKTPDFFDPVSGRFDRNAFLKLLAANNLTETKYNELTKSQIAENYMVSDLQAGLKSPITPVGAAGLFSRQHRDVDVIYITPQMVGAIAAPTDVQLTAFMKQNPDAYRQPEFRALTIVRFKTADALASANPSEADIQKIIDFRKDQQSTPETRTIVAIPAKDQATAQTISTRLMQGQDPTTVAKAVGSTVTRYDDKPKSAIPDAKTAEAAFALNAGQTSGPIQGSLGLTVVKVIAVTPAKAPDMVALRKAAETEARQRAAQMKITDEANKFEDAVTAGTDMADAARAVGATVVVVPDVDGNGTDKDGKKVDGVTPPVIQAAGPLQAKEKSDIIKEGADDYFMVRVDRIDPSITPPLAQVRDKVAMDWTAQQTVNLMKTKMADMATKLRGGAMMSDIAKSIGATVSKVTDLSVQDDQALAQKYGQELVIGTLQAKKGDYFTGGAPPETGQKGVPVRAFVATLDAINQADITALAPEVQKAVAQASQGQQGEIEDAVFRAAGKLVDVKTFPDRARVAIGLEATPPAATAPAPAAPAKK